MKNKNKVIKKISDSLGNKKINNPADLLMNIPNNNTTGIGTLEETFIEEVKKLSGEVTKLKIEDIPRSIENLIRSNDIRKVVLWSDTKTRSYEIEERLSKLKIDIILSQSDKLEIESCDLGITTCDYAISDTGTIVIMSNEMKSSLVSLLPPIHLVLVTPNDIVPNLESILNRIKTYKNVVLISGPSRTADIELIATLGVHGPKKLIVWVIV